MSDCSFFRARNDNLPPKAALLPFHACWVAGMVYVCNDSHVFNASAVFLRGEKMPALEAQHNRRVKRGDQEATWLRAAISSLRGQSGGAVAPALGVAHACLLQAKLPVDVHCWRARCGYGPHTAGCVRSRALDGRAALRCVGHAPCTRHAYYYSACATHGITVHASCSTACTLHVCTTCSARPPARTHPVLRNDAASLRHLGMRPRTLLHCERAQGGGAHVRPDDGTRARAHVPCNTCIVHAHAHGCVCSNASHRTCRCSLPSSARCSSST